MKQQLTKYTSKLIPALQFIKRYSVFISVVILLIIFSFLVFRINQFNQLEPNESAVTEKLQTVQNPKIDQSVLDKIQQLQDQNLKVRALFRQARDNPFHE